jgi:hypothetical protein
MRLEMREIYAKGWKLIKQKRMKIRLLRIYCAWYIKKDMAHF